MAEGEPPVPAAPEPSNPSDNINETKKTRRKRNRWGDAPPSDVAPAATANANGAAPPPADPKAKLLAMKAGIAARLAAAKNKAASSGGSDPAVSMRPALETTAVQPPPAKKAKVYDLDLTTTGPTFQKAAPSLVKKKKINPYLAHQEKSKDKETIEDDMDERLNRSSKPRTRHKPINFVEPGTFIEIAERKRERAANAEVSGFVSGRKKGEFVESAGMANVYGGAGDTKGEEGALLPRADASTQTNMPLIMDWWDMALLPSKLKKEVASHEGQSLSKKTKAQLLQLGKTEEEADEEDQVTVDLAKQCWEQASRENSKTSTLVQHIVPVKPLGAVSETKQPTLYLTKKELKRQRKLRRAEKQRELQDMQAAGLVPPPEPRLTLKNFISVLGDSAYLDPSQMEKKVNEQVQARQRAHMERNEAKKLTKEQRREKKAAKLGEDTSQSVTVALFFVKDMSHPYHRAKVDLNAQQNNITGGVLECLNPPLACVICEGGPKAIKRYTRLMLVRMKWKGQDLEEEEDDDVGDNKEESATHKFDPENKCELVWTGMASKRMFSSFVFQSCETSDMARKVLEAKGVAHFWDQLTTHASGRGESFNLKLADSEDEEDEKIVMMEE